MIDNEIAINEVLIRQFNKTAKDIPEDELFVPCVGHGHPPIWILGHLAIVAEMGCKLLGGSIAHLKWIRLFGPDSSDIISPGDDLTKDSMVTTVNENYERLRSLAASADEKALSGPHRVALFEGTSIKTVEHCAALLLTSHFGFHLGQLSSCRRIAGFGPLF
jgi:hypothetical protein